MSVRGRPPRADDLGDIYLVGAMNRLRRAYVDAAPEIRPFFTSGSSDDEAGIWATYPPWATATSRFTLKLRG